MARGAKSRKAEETPSQKQPAPQPATYIDESTQPFKAGDKVRLHSLQGAAHLNGLTGVCSEWTPSSGRWIVNLSSGEQKSLKPANLEAEPLGKGKGIGQDTGKDEKDQADVAEEFRMASDLESGFVCCPNLAAAQEALSDGEQRLEFGGLSDAAEITSCLDLVCDELLAGKQRRLRGLSFAGCNLDSAHVRRLAKALGGGSGPQVAAFGVSKNPGVEQEAWHELFAALPPNAVWLDFGDNELADDDTRPLLDGLAGRNSLDKLYLDGNKLRDLAPLCKVLPETGITNLDLGDNDVHDAALQQLARVLSKSVITILVIGTNPITAAGVKSLFDSLPRSSLDTLYLDNTGANDDCLSTLGSVLQESKLTELHLDETKITDSGIQALIPHIAASDLSYLDVSNNGISDATVTALEEAVSSQREAEEDGADEEESVEQFKKTTWRQEHYQFQMPMRCIGIPPTGNAGRVEGVKKACGDEECVSPACDDPNQDK